MLEKDRVDIETKLNRPLHPTEKQALKLAVERYGEFLEFRAVLG